MSPKKQWKNKFEEDLGEMNLRETDAMDRDGRRAAIKSLDPVAWRRSRLIEKVESSQRVTEDT